MTGGAAVRTRQKEKQRARAVQRNGSALGLMTEGGLRRRRKPTIGVQFWVARGRHTDIDRPGNFTQLPTTFARTTSCLHGIHYCCVLVSLVSLTSSSCCRTNATLRARSIRFTKSHLVSRIWIFGGRYLPRRWRLFTKTKRYQTRNSFLKAALPPTVNVLEYLHERNSASKMLARGHQIWT